MKERIEISFNNVKPPKRNISNGGRGVRKYVPSARNFTAARQGKKDKRACISG